MFIKVLIKLNRFLHVCMKNTALENNRVRHENKCCLCDS